jgi:hypothetical protein
MTGPRFLHRTFGPCRRTRRPPREITHKDCFDFCALLLGLIFTVFGLNGFLNFIHQPPPANPLAIQFLVSVSESHFAAFFFAIQLLGGLPLLPAPSSFRITRNPEVTIKFDGMGRLVSRNG